MAGTTRMILEEKRDLALFLAELTHKQHKWGEFDCSLWVADWVDRLTGTNWAQGIRDHYHDEKSAFKFARTLNPQKMMVGEDADKWKVPGYKEIDKDEMPLTGDIWWQDDKTHYGGIIIFNGLGYSVTIDDGLIRLLPEHFATDQSPSKYTKRFRRI